MLYVLVIVFSLGENAVDSGIPVITEHPLDVIVAKGEPATLNCAASGEDLQILWYKDGELVKTNRDESKSHRLVLQTGALFLLRVNNGALLANYCRVNEKTD
jgi:roundabout axon guidance receptor 2